MEVTVKEEKKNPSVSHRYITEFWEVNIPDKMSDDLKEKTEKLVDGRKDWPTFLYETFIKRMVYQEIKDRKLETGRLMFEESLLAIVQKWKENVKLREESKQTTLKDIPVSLGKVSAAKKEGPGSGQMDAEKKKAPVLKGPGKPLQVKKGAKK